MPQNSRDIGTLGEENVHEEWTLYLWLKDCQFIGLGFGFFVAVHI